MPEANVLYTVTAAVVLGLVAWVMVVLKTAKEPWAREVPHQARAERSEDAPLEKEALPPSSSESTTSAADATAEATAVTVEKKAEPEPKAEAAPEADAAEPAADGDKDEKTQEA